MARRDKDKGDKGKSGLFRRRDEAAVGSGRAAPEDLGPPPITDPMRIHPELVELADLVDRADWPALREFLERFPDEGARAWAADRLTQRPGVEVVLQDAVARDPADPVLANRPTSTPAWGGSPPPWGFSSAAARRCVATTPLGQPLITRTRAGTRRSRLFEYVFE